jgi:hypothetical protein
LQLPLYCKAAIAESVGTAQRAFCKDGDSCGHADGFTSEADRPSHIENLHQGSGDSIQNAAVALFMKQKFYCYRICWQRCFDKYRKDLFRYLPFFYDDVSKIVQLLSMAK